MDLSGGDCSCKHNFYYNAVSDDCEPCETGCKTCSDATTCTLCINATLMTLTSNDCICDDKYFMDSTANDCTGKKNFLNNLILKTSACELKCRYCDSTTNCTTCLNFTLMTLSGGDCTCADKYYFDVGMDDCNSSKL